METPPTRRCKNWLQSYRDYILPRTDAPDSFVFWSGIFTIAAVLRRRVSVPKKYLGLWTCYPHMYLMFVGPPGVRKTTAIDTGARALLTQIDGITVGPDFFTKESVLEKMQRSSDASMFMTVDEFSSVLQKAGKDGGRAVYDFFTAMYDSKTVIESSTKSSGTVYLENPTLSFFSATTPGWINNNMPEDVISGGFASRCIWVYAEEPRVEQMFFDGVELAPELERDLLLDLLEISNLEGEFGFTPEGLEYARKWTELPAPMSIKKNEKLGGYLNRRKMHVMKLAMIHSVLRTNELMINQEDWEFGVWACESIEPNLEKIFGGVGKNRYTTEIDRIVSFVRGMNFYTKQVVSRAEVLVNFKHSAEPRILNDLLTFAVDTKMLSVKERRSGSEKEYDFWVPEALDLINTESLK